MKKSKLLIFLLLVLGVFFLALANNNNVDAATPDLSTFTEWTATDALPTEGDYYLSSDVTLVDTSATRYINTGKTLNLDLKGHTITHYGGSHMAYYCVYYVNGGTLSIYDSVGTGKITGCATGCIWGNQVLLMFMVEHLLEMTLPQLLVMN